MTSSPSMSVDTGVSAGAAGVAVAADRHVGQAARLEAVAYRVENCDRGGPSGDAIVEGVAGDAVGWLDEPSDGQVR